DGSEQADERRGRTDGGENRKAASQTRDDRALAAGERVQHPVVLIDRVGQLVVLLEGGDAVVYDLAIGAVLLQLAGAFAQVRRLPEARPGALRLVHDLLLLEQLDEEDVPGGRGHDHEDEEGRPCDRTALVERGHQAEIACTASGAGCCIVHLSDFPLKYFGKDWRCGLNRPGRPSESGWAPIRSSVCRRCLAPGR